MSPPDEEAPTSVLGTIARIRCASTWNHAPLTSSESSMHRPREGFPSYKGANAGLGGADSDDTQGPFLSSTPALRGATQVGSDARQRLHGAPPQMHSKGPDVPLRNCGGATPTKPLIEGPLMVGRGRVNCSSRLIDDPATEETEQGKENSSQFHDDTSTSLAAVNLRNARHRGITVSIDRRSSAESHHHDDNDRSSPSPVVADDDDEAHRRRHRTVCDTSTSTASPPPPQHPLFAFFMRAASRAKRKAKAAGHDGSPTARPLDAETRRSAIINHANSSTNKSENARRRHDASVMSHKKANWTSLQRHQEPGIQASPLLHAESPPLFSMILGLRSRLISQHSDTSAASSGNPVSRSSASCSSGVRGVPTCALDEAQDAHPADHTSDCDSSLVLREEEEDRAEAASTSEEASSCRQEPQLQMRTMMITEECADDTDLLNDARAVSDSEQPVDAKTPSSGCPDDYCCCSQDTGHAAPSGFCTVWTWDALEKDDPDAAAPDDDGDDDDVMNVSADVELDCLDDEIAMWAGMPVNLDAAQGDDDDDEEEDDLMNVSADVELDSMDDEMVVWVGIPVNLNPTTDEDDAATDEDDDDADAVADDDDLMNVSADVELDLLDDEITMWVGIPVNLDLSKDEDEGAFETTSLPQASSDGMNGPGGMRIVTAPVNTPALRVLPSAIAAAC